MSEISWLFPWLFELCNVFFQHLQFLTGARKHRLLDIELFASDEVHARQRGLQCTVEMLAGIFFQRRKAGGEGFAQPLGDVINDFRIKHGKPL